MRKLIIIALLLPLFLTAASGCAQSCADQTETYRAEVDAIIEKWDDAVEIAGSTSRMSLSGPISDMQEIRREANGLEVPECAEAAHKLLLQAMDDAIDGFLAFLAQEEDSRVSDLMEIAGNRRVSFDREYGRLAEE